MTIADNILQWGPTNAPVASSRTDDIWFVDELTGWAVNSNGHIIKTTDGFQTHKVQFQAGVYLRCVGFANPSRGWVGTTSGANRLFETKNGGETWTPVTNLPAVCPSAICGLSVVNESVIYASGTNFPDRPARMIRTVDGGESWTGWEMKEHASLLVDTFFTSPEQGWVVGGKADVPGPSRDNVKPVVLFTEDGGKTWVNRVAAIQDKFPLGEWGWKIQFLDKSVGFIALENFKAGAILKTTDGGLTWERIPINDPQKNMNLEGIGFVDEEHGWVGGWGSPSARGASSETHDGGKTWRDANEIGRFINRFRFFGNPITVGYASGKTVFKYSSEPVPPVPFEFARPARMLDTEAELEVSGPVEIVFTVPQGAQGIEIDIWSRFGEHVRTLLHEKAGYPGKRSVVWDLKNDSGEIVPPEFYIYRVTIDANAESNIVRLKA